MSGFMRLTAYRASFADYVPMEGGFAEMRECDTVDSSEALQIVSDVATAWFARYSAPGYMDQTDSVGPFKTPREAAQACFDLYGEESEDPEHPSPDEIELTEVFEAIAVHGALSAVRSKS